MIRHIILVLMALVLACGCAAVQADVTVNWQTGGASIDKMGNNGLFGPDYYGNPVQTNCDKATLAASSGTIVLVAGFPQIVAINPLSFEVGQTGYQGTDESYTWQTEHTMTQDLTINGVTQTLVVPMTHATKWYWDSLQVQDGPMATFGNVGVRVLGWQSPFIGDDITVFTQSNSSISPLYAEFTVVPEPSSLMALAGGFGLLIPLIRRRRQ